MIIALVGPTGIGKSSLALKVAKEVKGEIVNKPPVKGGIPLSHTILVSLKN